MSCDAGLCVLAQEKGDVQAEPDAVQVDIPGDDRSSGGCGMGSSAPLSAMWLVLLLLLAVTIRRTNLA